MTLDERARDDLALIREALEEGQSYAAKRSLGMVVWGVALAAGFVATYAYVRGWSPVPAGVVWPIAMAVPWVYWLARHRGRTRADAPAVHSPTVRALRMLWLGLGIFLTSLTLIVLWSDPGKASWLAAVAAGAMGAGVFATAWLTATPWLRWVAVAWWLGELALFLLRDTPEMLLAAAALMLALLSGPGLALALRQRKLVAA